MRAGRLPRAWAVARDERYRICLSGLWPGLTGADYEAAASDTEQPDRPRFAYAGAFDPGTFRIVDSNRVDRAAAWLPGLLRKAMGFAGRLRAYVGADIVVTHLTSDLMAAAVVKLLRPSLGVVTIQYEMPPRRTFPRSLLGTIKRVLYRRADCVLCLVPSLRKHLVETYGLDEGRCAWLPFGVDTGFFRPATDGEREDFVLVPGNHLRDERAVLSLARSRSVSKIVRVANAPWVREAYVSALREDAGLGTALQFERSVSPQRLRELYQRARLVWLPLLPSREPAGLTAALEASACGGPLLVSSGLTCEALSTLGIPHTAQLADESASVAVRRASDVSARSDRSWETAAAVARCASVEFAGESLRQRVLAVAAFLRGDPDTRLNGAHVAL